MPTFERVRQLFNKLLYDRQMNRFVPRARSTKMVLDQWRRRIDRGSPLGVLPERSPAISRLASEPYEPYTMRSVAEGAETNLFSVISLFAGAGGSSLGYRLGGGRVHAAVEFGPAAAASYRRNHPSAVVEQRNVRDILNEHEGVERFLRKAGLAPGELDMLDASPPCTEFSLAGNGIGDQTVQKTHSGVKQTHVATLPFAYARFLHRTKAKVSVMENVPGLVMMTPELFERIRASLKFNMNSERAYYVNWKILAASDYGVPQKRKRIIVVSIRKDVAESIGITSDQDVLRVFPMPTSGMVTTRSALNNLEQTARDVRPYVKAMQLSHVLHLLGDLRGSSSRHQRLRNADTNFSLVRCSWDLPAPTLVIAGQKPDYRCGTIHPEEDRKFTVPELKRLFGLPDDFALTGTLDQAVECICNMVPPFMTKAISQSIYEKVLKPYRELTDRQ